MSGKTLIVYYSFGGTTEKVCNTIAEKLSADTVKLIPDSEPPRKGIGTILKGGYSALRPTVKIADLEVNLEDYTTVIIATPVWAGRCTPAIVDFFNRYGFKDKKTGIVVTSAGGKGQKAINSILEKLSGNTVSGMLNIKSSDIGTEDYNRSVEDFCGQMKE